VQEVAVKTTLLMTTASSSSLDMADAAKAILWLELGTHTLCAENDEEELLSLAPLSPASFVMLNAVTLYVMLPVTRMGERLENTGWP